MVRTVVTLGTPHYGTYMAAMDLPQAAVNLMSLFYGEYWFSNALFSMHPDSWLIQDLIYAAPYYSTGINWFNVAGIDEFWSNTLFFIHSDNSDGLVAVNNAILSYATEWEVLACSHDDLVQNPSSSLAYPFIDNWLTMSVDSDSDGLNDYEELNTYFTDPEDWDTDGDAVSDGDEVLSYGTNPNAWSSDGDILSDGQEIDWDYDPLDTDNPIDAEYLTYSAWQLKGTTGYVRANHYSAMDYVKILVRCKFANGYWTGYYQVGTDYTPTYYGDYYVTWTLPYGYVQMKVKVNAYDSDNHFLGSDYSYVTLPGGGGPPPPMPY